MPGHVVLFTAGAAVFALSKDCRMFSEPWDAIHLAASSSGTVFHSTQKKSSQLEAHHTLTCLPNVRKMCCVPLLSICRHDLYMHQISPVYFTTISQTPHFANTAVFYSWRYDAASLQWYLSCPFTTYSKFTLITFLSVYHIQPVYTDTILVPLPQKASLQWYLSCPFTTNSQFTLTPFLSL